MPPDTLGHKNCISYDPFLCFLTLLFANPASSFLFLNQERQPAPTFSSLVLDLPYPYLILLFLILLARLSQPYLLLQVWLVTRHTGLARSYFPECPQRSTPAICVVRLLLTHVSLNHLRDPASPHSIVCSFCQLLTIFPLTSSFPCHDH